MLEKRSHLGLYWVCLPVQHALPWAAMKCTGTLGMIKRQTAGYVQCRNMIMCSIWHIIPWRPITIRCTRKTLQDNLADGIAYPITIRKRSVFWEFVPMNPYSATAVFLIRNTATKDSAGSPISLKMSGLRPLCMTGRSMISGMPTIALIIHIMNYMIYFTRPAWRFTRCA